MIIRITIIAIYARQRKIITPKDFDLEALSGHPQNTCNLENSSYPENQTNEAKK